MMYLVVFVNGCSGEWMDGEREFEYFNEESLCLGFVIINLLYFFLDFILG